ncbi:MAG: triose-phosphate isomerase [Alphaproteobacteria bacterium]|nr:triose-phosphate isomerase [Alphaproteobacteria bacterium]
MAERRQLVAGNWKMNGMRADGLALARGVAARASRPHRCDLLVCPPATLIAAVGEALAGSPVALGGQDCHEAASGAFTGDISAEMLRDAGCTHVILGHSERRHGRGESDADVHAKVIAAWRAGLIAIVCVGETRAEREAGRAVAVVTGQIAGSVPAGADAAKLVIAYEPVWAIGTGLTPTTLDIIEIHAAIRAHIPGGTRILYGGSVNPRNAAEILALPEVDGGLIGGASLKADDFWAIAAAAQ